MNTTKTLFLLTFSSGNWNNFVFLQFSEQFSERQSTIEQKRKQAGGFRCEQIHGYQNKRFWCVLWREVRNLSENFPRGQSWSIPLALTCLWSACLGFCCTERRSSCRQVAGTAWWDVTVLAKRHCFVWYPGNLPSLFEPRAPLKAASEAACLSYHALVAIVVLVDCHGPEGGGSPTLFAPMFNWHTPCLWHLVPNIGTNQYTSPNVVSLFAHACGFDADKRLVRSRGGNGWP